ncbi:ammonium transporter [Candidatus Nitronereus thalassa]|uniref:Ammonium transporter n=1 Tax=Candidatus Nitronereus thalassa TaxID=3020898 RepID=A0ABU3K494_9BACT|nr:ammonium transporter [Candidatus Nitronereus thalassa]MDT7041183.1 ammonium transporter [Candidatus Nitronereus thalassa]
MNYTKNEFNRILSIIISVFLLVLVPTSTFAQEVEEAQAISAGDTGWVLTSSALVLLMTIPGLALFYGGMVRNKNVLSTMMHSFISVCIVSIVWVFWGYTIAFGSDVGGVMGSFEFFGLSGVGTEAFSGTAIPELAFMVFQLMFAGITVALISGAIAERMKFSAFALFAVLWATFIYAPLAHWVWGGGWLAGLGELDFAGGTVVHISSGVAALAAALVLGKRHGYGSENLSPHNLPFTIVGAALLWVGWFGFNAGSALAANGVAASAFVATHVATAAGALGWIAIERVYRGKPTVLGAASGAVAGLVAITPAAGFVGPISAIWVGLGGGVFCYAAVMWKSKLGYDDALDVLGIHGIGGTWGAIATGLFASVGGGTGLFFGNPGQVVIQLVGVGATWIFSFIGTFIILKVLDMTIGLRVTKEEEALGLDLSEHSERAYA